MNKLIRFFYGCFLYGMPVVACIVFFYVAHTIITDPRSKFICIEDYMYMRVENNLLIYPSPSDAMRCSVFEYIETNKKEVK